MDEIKVKVSPIIRQDVFKEYLVKEQAVILDKAKKINPLADFFGKKLK